jgi:3-oxoacyl-[acyl-carrier-protein] synthase-3
MSYSRIVGTGSYLPPRVMENREFEKRLDTSDAWIRERTGIERRHIAAESEASSDLALHAARRALEAAGIGAEDLDLIVVATSTPDYIFPSTACLLQAKLGVKGCAAFDVQAVCSGFVYGLATADSFIRTGQHRKALVVGAEVFSAPTPGPASTRAACTPTAARRRCFRFRATYRAARSSARRSCR